ncbi:MAG TPA: alpha/beta hydrolase [Candidatus Eisenbacteria bacterium]|nr:alpha/beta hydrolase [Candidatus Eisenbacteria bacterium]
MPIAIDTTQPIATRQSRMGRRKTAGLGLLLLATVFVVYASLRPLSLLRAAGRLALLSGGIHGHYAQVGPYQVHYYEGGDGPPLVFVHGLGAESLNWVPAMLGFRHQFHVYAIDLLGHGETEKPDIAYSIAQQSEMLHQFLVDRKAVPADVVGISMGGWVTLKLALDHPEAVNRLVVADAAGLKFQTDITVKNFLPVTPDEFSAFMTMLTPRHYYVPYPMRRDFLSQVADHAWITRRIFSSFLTYQDVLDGKLQEVKAPVLVIWGKEEKLIPLSVGEEMNQQLPNSSLLVCSDSGHLAVYECWNKLEPEVESFLASPEPPAPYVREVSSGERTAPIASSVTKVARQQDAAQR